MVRHCKRCNEYFGTVAGFYLHRGKRGCLKQDSLTRNGLWKGHKGIWWTTDLGHDDTAHDWLMAVPDDWAYLDE